MDAFWRRAALMAGAFASLAISGPSHGADVTISFSRLSAPGFELGRGQVELATGARDRGGSATPGQLRVFVRKVALGPAFVGLDRLDLRCTLALGTSPAGSGGETSCVDGQVKVLMPNEAFEQSGRFSVSTSARRLRARLKGLGVGEGSVSGTFALDDAGVSKATLSAQGIALKNLLRPGAIGLESVSGKLDVELVRNAGDGNRDEGNLTVRARGVDMSDPQGTFVTEGVAGEVDLKFVRGPKGEYDFNANSHFRVGVVLIDPLVVDFEEDELRGQATGVWSKALRITRARLSHGPNINATLNARIRRTPTWGVTRGRVTLQPAPFSVVFERYLAGFIADLPIGALTSAGTIAANAKWRDGPELVELSLTDLEVDDGERFAMWDVNGDVRWARQDAGPSAVEWGGVSVAGVALGAGRASGRLHGGNVELDAPIVMEVLGGEVALSTLRAADLGTDEMLVESNLRVSGVSMEEVSASMGWPPFAGELEGRLDNIRVRQDAVSVDGGVSVNLFDGTVRIDNLRLADPFGALPRLSADVLVNNVSLGLLTNAFEFGGIEGGLDGVVTDLQLVGWKVAGFDARLFSSPNDKRKHRISQRAVDNLASIGGGPQAVLSQTFLRFFEEFSYDKLGLSCRLVNEVCEMGGVEAADSGYYIVKGAGIPRIDIRGYRNRVSWPSLVERLIAAARSKGPVVQ